MIKTLRTGLLIFLAILVAWFAPLEKTLGELGKLVYFHGAWVWAALILFAYAGASALYGILRNNRSFQYYSIALGWSALGFWLVFLPMSLWVMQANWNGLFLDEPRFRIPLNFAIVLVCVQVGLFVIRDVRWSAVANILLSVILFWNITRAETILHPQSPIFNDQAGAIRWVFIALLILLTSAGWSLADNLLPIVYKVFEQRKTEIS